MRALKSYEILSCFLQMPAGIYPVFAFPYYSRKEIENYQLRKLKNLVHHAYHQVPFYKDKYDAARIKPQDILTLEDFKRLPIVTKEEMIQNYPDRILSCGTDLEDSLLSVSSGSSGKIINVVYGIPTLARYMLAGLRTYAMGINWRPWFKQMNIYASRHPMDHVLKTHWLSYAWTLQGTESLVNDLCHNNPDFMSCYPSVLNEMRAFMLRKKIQPPRALKAIFVNSEMSFATDREKLSAFFGVPVYYEYSSEELNRIAAQCRYKNYHLFEDMNFIEILGADGQTVPEGEVGEVVGTHLLNYTMPFIRYRQNDLAAIGSRECSCGRSLKVLESVEGRKNDSFVFNDGKILSSGFLLDLAYSILLAFPDSVCDFCLIQETSSLIIFEILPGLGFSLDIQKQIQHKLIQAFPQHVQCELRICERLTKTKSGSKNPIISRIA